VPAVLQGPQAAVAPQVPAGVEASQRSPAPPSGSDGPPHLGIGRAVNSRSFLGSTTYFNAVYNHTDYYAAEVLNRSAREAAARNPSLTPIMLDSGKVALMPNLGRFSAEDIQSFINIGAKVYDQIQIGSYDESRLDQIPPAVGEDSVCALMWYLQALAASKASSSAGFPEGEASAAATAKEFNVGGMLIDDQNGKIKHFLDLASSYGRSSDHFTRYQIDRHTSPRGVDVLRTFMPYNANSVLYQKLPDDTPAQGAKLLYVKMEPFGYRGLSTKETAHPEWALRKNRPALEPGFKGALNRFFINLKETLARIFSLNPDRAAINAGTHNLEKVSGNVVENFYLLIDRLKANYRRNSALAPIIRDLNLVRVDSSHGGVHMALKALNTAEAQVAALADDPNGQKQSFLDLLGRFKEELISKVGDHPELRFGSEVILTRDDFGPIYPRPLSSPDWEGEVRFERDLNPQEAYTTESHFNLILQDRGQGREDDIETFIDDFGRQMNLGIYDPFTEERYDIPPIPDYARSAVRQNVVANPNAVPYVDEAPDGYAPQEPVRPAPYYDTRTDPTVRNRIFLDASLVPMPLDDVRYRYQNVEDALVRISGGSQQFANSVRAIMNQGILTDLVATSEYQFATQTGTQFSNSNIRVDELRFFLTRITPRPADGEPAPESVEYRFEIVNRDFRPEVNLDNPNPPNSVSPVIPPNPNDPAHYAGHMQHRLSFTLTHNTRTEEVSARGLEGSVRYNVKRFIDQPPPQNQGA
jgi:hypothetical protein